MIALCSVEILHANRANDTLAVLRVLTTLQMEEKQKRTGRS